MDRKGAADLIRTATRATEPLGLEWHVTAIAPTTPAGRADARLRLRYAGQVTDFVVEAKTNLRPPMLGAIQHQLAAHGVQKDRTLLVADHVTPAIAAHLRKQGLQFIDAAGNAYLNQPPLLIWITGQKLAAPIADIEPRNRAFQPTGLKVLFALLCRPEAVNLPYREIAEMAGVAHGTVGWVIPELPRLGFMVEIDNRRRLVERERLLARWVEAYAQRLRPKLRLARYEATDLKWTTTFLAQDYGLLLGGEPAANRMDANLRPGTATFYGDQINARLVVDQRLRPDPGGNIEVMKRFWNFQTPNPGLVPPILVYADLLAIGDARCLEAAHELYDGIADRLKR